MEQSPLCASLVIIPELGEGWALPRAPPSAVCPTKGVEAREPRGLGRGVGAALSGEVEGGSQWFITTEITLKNQFLIECIL